MKRLALSFFVVTLLACGGGSKSRAVESGLDNYVRTARQLPIDNRQNEGSLWTRYSELSSPFRDVKARNIADIVTIQVLETTNAIAEATTEAVKQTEIEASIPNLFGAEKSVAELPSLLDVSKSAQFTGDAATSRRNVLTTTITATVVEVFPNGFLLIEGNREILINNERQIVTVRGIVRPEDISPQNRVLSTNIAELEIEVDGQGIVAETQEPGILFRVLAGIWPF